MSSDLNVIHASQLARVSDHGGPRRGQQQRELDLVPDGAVAIRAGRITAVGPTEQVLRQAGDDVPTLDARGLCVLPGLVECHSHPLYGSFPGTENPAWEYVRRLQGATSNQLRAEGGGIWATIQATTESSDEALLDHAADVYAQILAGGVTTLEVKSGYGFTLDRELRQLRLLKESAVRTPMDLVYTYMGAQFKPQDGTTAEDYANAVIDKFLPAVKAQGIAEFQDLCCEEGDYSVSLAERLLTASRRLGLSARVHADASSPSRGWVTAVTGGAIAADHLTYTLDDEIRSTAGCNTIAVVMPLAEQIYLEPRRANVRLFIESDIPLAIATDFCSAIRATSMLLTIALACAWFRLTPAEAIVGATLNAAYTLKRGHDRGSLDVGKRGDLTLVACTHPDELALRIGAPVLSHVVIQGRIIG